MEICMFLDSCCANFANISTVHICIPLLSIWMLYVLLIGTILELFWSLKRSVLWFTLLAKYLSFSHSHILHTEYQHLAFHSSILVSIPRRSVRDRYCLPYLPHTSLPLWSKASTEQPLQSWSDNLINKQKIKSRLHLLLNPSVWLVRHVRCGHCPQLS